MLYFGISKEDYKEERWLGVFKRDWAIDLYEGTKWNDWNNFVYGDPGKVTDEYTCEVDRKAGKVKFYKNGSNMG